MRNRPPEVGKVQRARLGGTYQSLAILFPNWSLLVFVDSRVHVESTQWCYDPHTLEDVQPSEICHGVRILLVETFGS